MTHLPIQIVDEHDKPVGGEDMFVAQEKGLIHRIVRIMVEDREGRVLLQKRSKKMKRWPGCWDNSAAGHVDAGEDYDTAAKRELFEEIGIKRSSLEELGTYFTDRPLDNLPHLRRFNRVYKVIADKTEIVIDEDEVAEVRWFTLGQIKQLIKEQPEKVTDGLIDVIERYYTS